MERIPGCRGKMIKDCGSEIPWEQPVEFAKEIAQFKQQLASSGSSSPPQQSQHI